MAYKIKDCWEQYPPEEMQLRKSLLADHVNYLQINNQAYSDKVNLLTLIIFILNLFCALPQFVGKYKHLFYADFVFVLAQRQIFCLGKFDSDH